MSDDRPSGTPKDQRHALALQRWKQGMEATKDSRLLELEDLRFYAGKQFDNEVYTSRQGSAATGAMPAIPARPLIEINKTLAPVRTVLNAERESDMGIEIVPADDFGGLGVEGHDDEEIEIRVGLTRRIQRTSESRDARTWAFARAVQCGTGYYAVTTRYVRGKTWDQEVGVRKLYNQNSVMLDPSHEMSDGSDADWGFIGTDIPIAQYRADYPEALDGTKTRPCQCGSEQEFRALGDEAPGWTQGEGETRTFRVVEYFYTVRATRKLALLPDGSSVWIDEVPAGVEPVDTRSVIEKSIKWMKLDGWQILDETDWPGPDMPIVKVVGEELQPYDEERRTQGMVRPMIAPVRGFSYMVSKQVEDIALTPIPAWQYAEGQIEGYEAWYDAANTRAIGRLPYKQIDLENRPAPPPFRGNITTPIQAMAQSVEMFDQMIQAVSIHDPSLGKASPALKSGRAIDRIVQQDRQGTSNYLDNLARSIRYEGQIVNGLLYPIYGTRPGRLARIVTGEGEAQTVVIGQPAQPMPMKAGQQAPKQYTLTKGFNANVVVKVSKDYDTRRQQEATTLGELISAQPQLMGVFGDLFFKNQDGPGHQEMAERAKVMLVPPVQAYLEQQKAGSGMAELPPEVSQALAQGQQALQENQQLKQLLESKTAEKQAEQQAKTQGELEIIAAQHHADMELAATNNAAKIEAARISAAKGVLDTVMASEEEAQARGHESTQNAHDRAHDVAMQHVAQQHQQGMAQQAQDAAAQGQIVQQGHEQDMAAQQQVAQPEPAEGESAQ